MGALSDQLEEKKQEGATFGEYWKACKHRQWQLELASRAKSMRVSGIEKRVEKQKDIRVFFETKKS